MHIRIDELRELKGLTVDELAQAMGISRSYLQNLKNGKSTKRFNQDHFESLLKIFNCSVHDLFEDNVPKPRLITNNQFKDMVPFKERLFMEVITKAIELIKESPAILAEYSPDDLSKIFTAAYLAGTEEEAELGKESNVSKANLKNMLKMYHGGKR